MDRLTEKLIEQRGKSDCVICCVAMAVGRTYDEVSALTNMGDFGLSHSAEFWLLRRFGWTPIRLFGFRPMYPSIVTVASLNLPGRLHAVWWDGDRLFDPSPMEKHTIESVSLGYAHVVVNYSPEIDGFIAQEREEFQAL